MQIWEEGVGAGCPSPFFFGSATPLDAADLSSPQRYSVKRAINKIAASSARAMMGASAIARLLSETASRLFLPEAGLPPGRPSRAALFKETRAALSPPTPLLQAEFGRAGSVRGFTNVCSLLRLYTG